VSEAKHSPAPWRFQPTTGYSCGPVRNSPGYVVYAADGYTVFHLPTAGRVLDSTAIDNPEADARIIAAAPDLLAACESVYYELDTLTGGEPTHPLANTVGMWKSALRAAIAKAKGQP
jgi:hypothetical protein